MIPEFIEKMFRTPVEKVVSDELHQARLDLLNAQAHAEHWNGAVTTLKRRVARLQGLEVVPEQEMPAVPQVETAG